MNSGELFEKYRKASKQTVVDRSYRNYMQKMEDLRLVRECGTTENLSINHKPIALGGTNDADNLEILCRKCHMMVITEQTFQKRRCDS